MHSVVDFCMNLQFSRKTLLREPLENFVRILWSYCRYLKGCPRIVLSNGKKIMITRRSKHKISQEIIKTPKKSSWKSFRERSIFAWTTKILGETSLQKPLENFSRILWSCCRYMKGCSRVVLYIGKKIMITRRTQQKILQEAIEKHRKKILPCVAL